MPNLSEQPVPVLSLPHDDKVFSYVLKKIKKEFQLKAFVERAFQIFFWLHVDKGV